MANVKMTDDVKTRAIPRTKSMKPEKAARRIMKQARRVADTRPENYQTEATYKGALTRRMNDLRRAFKDYDQAMGGKPWHQVNWRQVVTKARIVEATRGETAENPGSTRTTDEP